MTLSISLPPETEEKLRRRAAALGKDVADLALEAVEEKLALPETFLELLAPVHEATAKAGGVDVEELDALVEESRRETFLRRQARPGS